VKRETELTTETQRSHRVSPRRTLCAFVHSLCLCGEISRCSYSTREYLIQLVNRPSQVRNRDRAAYDQCDIEGIHELFAGDATIGALLDVICDAIVTTQNN